MPLNNFIRNLDNIKLLNQKIKSMNRSVLKNRILFFLFLFVFSLGTKAQHWMTSTSQKMTFQKVIRNNFGKIHANKEVGVRLTIIKKTPADSIVYFESQVKVTNKNGLLTYTICESDCAFKMLDWTKGPFYLKTEFDINGGTNYEFSELIELVSVPYAFQAKHADSSNVANSVDLIADGTRFGDMNYWDGTKWVPISIGSQGQTLTFCEGKPAWVYGDACPGAVASLNCSGAINNGTLTQKSNSTGVSTLIPYTGGNGRSFEGKEIYSIGVFGLKATLTAGTFANGNGTLLFTITGTPLSGGTAWFGIEIGGYKCSFSRNVEALPTSGYGQNISDIDGNTYKTVYIGSQQWMAENLKTTKYNDGTVIPQLAEISKWKTDTSGAWSIYNNDVANNIKHGKLYNWFVVNKINTMKKNVCPAGWHVPENIEWYDLVYYLGGTQIAGGKMKEVGTLNWTTPNANATNSSLFTALPSGKRSSDASFTALTTGTSFWTASEDGLTTAFNKNLGYNNGLIFESSSSNKSGYSIRCIKD